MKLAFLSLNGTYDYYQIGGTDSYMRRLTMALLKLSGVEQIEWIFYGANNENVISHQKNFNSLYYKSFLEAIVHIRRSVYDEIIVGYLRPKDRIMFGIFRKSISFPRTHCLVFFYPEIALQRKIKFMEYSLFPYDGYIFCTSKRQINEISKRTKNKKAIYLPPIVPDYYFITPQEKDHNIDVLNVCFLGRIDPRKGVPEAVDIMKRLSGKRRISKIIYGIHIKEDMDAYELHKYLMAEHELKYIEIERDRYSIEIDKMVSKILRETHVLLQPYRNMSSTLDTPLILLEAMASLCAVVTRPVGEVRELYGNSPFIINNINFVTSATELLSKLDEEVLRSEQKRLYDKKLLSIFSSSTISSIFMAAINS